MSFDLTSDYAFFQVLLSLRDIEAVLRAVYHRDISSGKKKGIGRGLSPSQAMDTFQSPFVLSSQPSSYGEPPPSRSLSSPISSPPSYWV